MQREKAGKKVRIIALKKSHQNLGFFVVLNNNPNQ
jgi:hypothetical protein